jgi:hypothetical protein
MFHLHFASSFLYGVWFGIISGLLAKEHGYTTVVTEEIAMNVFEFLEGEFSKNVVNI